VTGGWSNSDRRQELPHDWPKRRARILRRDPICLRCHSAPSTDADHIGDPLDHSEANLQGLCHPCHVLVTIDRRPTRRRPDEPHPGMLDL
jgi:5-methylcytosine-specific restriction enzyme A